MARVKRATLVERVNTFPEELLDEVAAHMDEVLAAHGGTYRPTAEEVAGIERGLRAAKEGRFASQQAVDEVLAKFRR
jgi:hypothetical protein